MQNYSEIIEFAPFIIIILLFIWQNNIFVKPELLEKKHRQISSEIDKSIKDLEKNIKEKYVELNAYKEFQNHIYSALSEANKGINDLKEFLMKGRRF